MFNFTLFKYSLKENFKTLLIFTAVLSMYFVLVIPMYDPSLGRALQEFTEAMPQMMSMFGMNAQSTTMIGFLSTYLYGFIMLVFPMVFSILCANKLVARYVDNGSMFSLLAAPVKRFSVVFTQMKLLATCIFFLTVWATGVGIVSCQISFKGQLDIPKFILLNVGLLALQLFIGGVCFLCSCIFNDTKYSIGLGAGIPALSFIIQMMSNVNDKLDNVKFASFFTLFNPEKIIEGDNYAILGIVILFIGAIALFTSAIIVFCKKDMPV